MGILTHFKRTNVLFIDYKFLTALLLGQIKKTMSDHHNNYTPNSKTDKSLTIITELEIM